MPLAPRFWYQDHSFYAHVLSPLSGVYRSIVAVRKACYRKGIKKTTSFSVPVIVVGNITVGGTGKTPLVIELANWLQTQGFRPGIVSRGYRGIGNEPRVVTAVSDPTVVGDEPVLIARKTASPLVVCPNRPLAVQQLLTDYDCNVIISDDGLQHYALGRDIEIAVVDGDRQFGNRFCLPAGPLREPVSRLKTVDFVITHGVSHQDDSMQLKIASIYQLINPNNHFLPERLKGNVVHAVAGIGHPHRFFRQIEELGATVLSHPFPDHHRYQLGDFHFNDDAIILMTEKDAVKCGSFADERLWCVAVDVVLSETFLSNLLKRLDLRYH